MKQVNVSNSGETTIKFVVQSGVVRPKATRKGGEHSEVKYPFKTMKVDECFTVPDKETAQKAQRAGGKAPYNVSTSYVPAQDENGKTMADGSYWVFLNGPKEVKTSAQV